MGRAGIRRRRPAHHLEKVRDEVSAADQARAFGSFRWGTYSPAGTWERLGFFGRQWARARTGVIPRPRLRDHELRGLALWLGVIAVVGVGLMLLLGVH